MSSTLLSNRYWHDGVLISCKTENQDNGYNVDLCVALYESEEAPERHRIQWTFLGARNLVLTMDMALMTQNMHAGNINDCEVNMEEKRLSMYLVEGFLKLDFDGVAEAKRFET